MGDPLTGEDGGLLGSGEILSTTGTGGSLRGGIGTSASAEQTNYTTPHPQQPSSSNAYMAARAAALAANPPKSFCSKVKLGQTSPLLAGLVVAPGQLIYAMEATSFAVNLPIIAEKLSEKTSTIQWVIHAELIICCGFGCLAPTLADRFGISSVYIAAGYIFGLFTLALTFAANSLAGIIICRLLASFGLAMLLPLGNPMAYLMTSRQKLPIVLMINSSATPIGTIFSSLLSGFVAEKIGWQYMMTIIGSLSLVHASYSIFLCLHFKGNRAIKIDYIGAFFILLAAALFIFGMTSISEGLPWYAAAIALPLGVGFFVIFFFWNTRWAKHPLYPRQAFNPSVLRNLLAQFLNACLYFGERFFSPYIIVRYWGMAPLINGCFSAIGGVLSIGFSPLFTLANRKIVARLMIIIFSLVFTGSLLVEALLLKTHVAVVVVMGSICIVAFIALSISIQTASMVNTPVQYAPIIGSLNSIMVNLGHSVGVALGVIVQSNLFRHYGGDDASSNQKGESSYGTSIMWGDVTMCIFGVSLFITAFFMGVLKSDRGKIGFSERRLARTKHYAENINNSGEMVEISANDIVAQQEQRAMASLYQPKFM
ncbi:Transporter, MFS superfamily protein [Giardia muris]|uniref:Transporter, MFS superfamily protein n=1 Tax=Giardia muris TaxID=5742 RepID=A0A4Z1T7T2_GIAMU|nr:Transporter, MFS superfamily protein [Giardia muris]|eukprot:TNJ28551.1 Transporter, MFS superfamily protein [Giardia muris]